MGKQSAPNEPPVQIEVSTLDQIREILECLPVLEHRSRSVDGHAEGLTLIASTYADNLPIWDGWDSRTRRGLKRFAKVANDLGGIVHNLPLSAWDALQSIAPKVYTRAFLSSSFFFRLAQEATLLSERPLPRAKGGRPVSRSSSAATAITAYAAYVYAELTGKHAGPGRDRVTEEPNEFETLLADLFKVLALQASPEVHARALADREQT